MEILVNTLWSLWLGGCLGYLGIIPNQLRFWVVLVPTVLLVELSRAYPF